MYKQNLPQKMRETIRTYDLYKPDEKTLVGFSGGADSTCLLYALSACLGKEHVAAFHLNHMLRGEESMRDEAFCREFCERLDIPFLSKRVNIRELAGNSSLEETARNVRYRELEAAAHLMNCTTVSLAHHAGDNLETMIFHLCRGAGLQGLSGIPVKRPLSSLMIVRPLLDCTREDILAYLEENGLSYVTDSTNTDTAYTRNFIRHEILPKLREINRNAEENARKTAKIAENAAFFLKQEAISFLTPYPKAEVPTEALRALAPVLLYEVLAVLYERAGGETLSAVQSAAIIDLVSEGKNGRSASLSGSITAKIDGEKLRFFREKDEKSPVFCEKIPLKRGENHPLAHLWVYLDVPADEKLCENSSFRASVKVPAESVPTLYFRARENGEGYRFGGMTRRFKKLLSSADSVTKNRPILCDENGILWHPNFKIADRAKTDDGVEIVYIETKKGET